jgi:transcriptional regulator with GAF, ATPase, and Fis domain
VRAGRSADVAPITARAMTESLPPAARSRLLSNEAVRLLAAADAAGARSAARQALELAEAARDPEAEGVAALTASAVMGPITDAGEFDALTKRALAAFHGAGSMVGELRARGMRASAASRRQQREEAGRIYREAIAIARERGLRLPLEELLVSSGGNLVEDGRYREAREDLSESVRLALEDGRPRGAAIGLTNLALLEGLAGRRGAALRHARHAIRLAGAYFPDRESYALRSLAQAERIAGRRGRALAAARRALAVSAKFPDPNEHDWCRIELGRALAAAGRWNDAGRVLEAALEESRPVITIARVVLLVLAGRAALRRGDLEAAHTRHAAARDALAQHAALYSTAMVEALGAELALAGGRIAEGAAAGDRALESLRALGAYPERAHAALEFARLVLAREGETRAPVGAWLELAAAAFERLGDHRNREHALGLSVEWLRRAGSGDSRPAGARDLLEAVGRLLDSISDFRELTRRAITLVVEQLHAERGMVLLADAETGVLAPVAERGAVDAATRQSAVGYSRRVVQRVAESGGSLLIGDAPSDPEARSKSVMDLRLRSIVCVPMHLGGRVVGAVYLDSRTPDLFGDEDRALLEGFAHLMAVAIEKSRGHEEMVRANEQLVGENLSLRQVVGARFNRQGLIGTSLAMQRVLALVERAAAVSSTVLLTGENGTGKELIARILHHGGKRRLKPFVAVNCGAIPKTLLESELFGILPQVATGVRGRDGRFVQADGGTLFLDEIGEMPLEQQVALLSAISNREITPVGGGHPIPVDVRIMAATNVDLRRMLEQGTFREDLYYRLNVIPIEVPPLRERKADIPALARHFVEFYAHQQERRVPRLTREFMTALVQSDWPGNVRELQNYIERVLAMTPGDTLHPSPPPRHPGSEPAVPRRRRGTTLADLVKELECRSIAETLERTHGNQSLAARELGMTEQSLRYRIKKYRLGAPRQNQRTRQNR